jgi:hypothetical protein
MTSVALLERGETLRSRQGVLSRAHKESRSCRGDGALPSIEKGVYWDTPLLINLPDNPFLLRGRYGERTMPGLKQTGSCSKIGA